MYPVHYIYLIVAGILVSCCTAAIQPPPQFPLTNRENLEHLFLSSRTAILDPHLALTCFVNYIAESNNVGTRYSQDYRECLINANNARNSTDREFLPIRQKLDYSAERICASLNACRQQNNTLDALNCHAAGGSNNTIAAYSISGNASEQALLLQERYRLIDLRLNKCINAADRINVERVASIYNYLQECLDGRVPPKSLVSAIASQSVPSTTSSTTTTTTTTTTTEAPTSAPDRLTTAAAKSIDLPGEFKQLLNLLH